MDWNIIKPPSIVPVIDIYSIWIRVSCVKIKDIIINTNISYITTTFTTYTNTITTSPNKIIIDFYITTFIPRLIPCINIDSYSRRRWIRMWCCVYPVMMNTTICTANLCIYVFLPILIKVTILNFKIININYS